MHEFYVDKLKITIAETSKDLGEAASERFAEQVNSALQEQEEIAVILATGNSQLDFVHALVLREDIDWSKISILHMDEYLGMPASHSASFRRWMHESLVEPVSPKAFYGVQGDAASIEEEIVRYSTLVRNLDPVITVMGIGENGHLAFNDPPADFETTEIMRLVELDEECRLQQVGEGHFASLEDTPRQALTLTVYALLRSSKVLVLTPEARKARAVKRSLEGPVTALCPASILQTQPHATLFLDRESASMLTIEGSSS